MGWVTFSLSERLRFPFCWYLLKGKHVRCLITVWHLTVFSDQSDVVFHIYLYIYVGHLEERQQGKKKQCCHFPQAFQRQAFSTAINIRYRECCAHSFPFYLCLFFPLVLSGQTQSAGTSSLPSELKKNHFPVSKNVNRPKVRRRVNWTVESNWKRLRISSESPLLRHEIVNLHLCTYRHFSHSARCSPPPPLGHCHYIFLYRFRICSTVNYQLYIILEESRKAGVKQQSHQSLWLHNSCHPYSNKIYNIVNHQDANVCCVCVCVCVLECW